MRLDSYLFEKRLVQSRQKAQELIRSGCVKLDGKIAHKSSILVDCDANDPCVEIIGAKQWVARSGEKLHRFLLQHPVVISGKNVLDVGSSTGGFSEVLLYFGAEKITCVDVGSNQLHSSLRTNPKIELFENQDIRTFLSPPFDLIVCDVSFISLRLLLDAMLALMHREMILLFKPQYEVGKTVKRNKKGVIMDSLAITKSLEDFLDDLKGKNLQIKVCEKSQIKGKCGNEEYFIDVLKI